MSTFVPTNRLFRGADAAFVLLVWALATAVNAGKAAHVDDGAHLAIARHILADPLHPMRGIVFWGVHPEPIHALNQPHLFYYVLAAALGASGGSLLVAHLALALTILPGMFALHALAAHLFGPDARTKRRLATALVFLGPGFLPGQNLMGDAPLLSLVCVMLWALLTAEGERTRGRLVLAGVALGLACLVKYTALALLPLFVIDARLARDGKRLLPIAIALALLAAYAVFNVLDYGGVHVLERQPGGVGDFGLLARFGVTLARAALFVLTLGAIAFAPFALETPRRTWAMLGAAFVVLVIATRIVATVGPLEMRDEPWAVTLLRTAFFLSGVLAIARLSRSVDLGDRHDVLLASALGLITAFVVVLSPFVAVRHAMLVLPPLTLLLLRRAEISDVRAIAVAGVVTLIGLAVATGDRVQAGVYREAGQRYRERSATPGRTWFVGHWGWQWYAEDAGLSAYDPGVSVLAPGDTLIRPALVDAQPIDPRDEACLARVDEVSIPAGGTAIARTITTRQGYYAVWQGLPYGPSDEPLERFTTYRVTCFAASPSTEQPVSR
jgi:hypothetical protein